MQSAVASVPPAVAEATGLSFVVFGTVAFSIVMSVLFLVTRGKDNLYDRIGEGGLTPEREYASPARAAPDSPAARAEQEQEIRQMLRARNDRRARRGEPALDVEAEVSRLLAPAASSGEHEAALVEEVRQLVVARNERRLRQGLEALDVEAEVRRTLQELG